MLMNRDLPLWQETGMIKKTAIHAADNGKHFIILINDMPVHTQAKKVRTFVTADGAMKALIKVGITECHFDFSKYTL